MPNYYLIGKLIGKALRSEPVKDAMHEIGKGVNTVASETAKIGSEAYSKIHSKVADMAYFKRLVGTYSVLEKILDRSSVNFIEITRDELEKLLNLFDGEKYIYHVKSKYLLLMYGSIFIDPNYFDQVMSLKNKIEMLYTEEAFKYLLSVKNDGNFMYLLYNQLQNDCVHMCREIHKYEEKYSMIFHFDNEN